MKYYARPVRVGVEQGRPRTFRWRGNAYRILEELDHWRVRTRWWAQEDDREYFRVLACPQDYPPRPEHSGVYELCRRGNDWRMERVMD